MSIRIDHITDIDKLLAFLSAGAKTRFDIPEPILKEVVDQVRKWAKDRNVHVNLTMPDSAKLAAFTGTGAVCGLAAGLLLGLASGALAAAGVAGAAAGYAAAHITIVITPSSATGRTTVTIA